MGKKKTTQTTAKKKLGLKKDTLKKIDAKDLDKAAGGLLFLRAGGWSRPTEC